MVCRALGFKFFTGKSCWNVKNKFQLALTSNFPRRNHVIIKKINYQHAYSQIRLEREQVTIRNQRFNMKTSTIGQGKDSLIKFIFPNVPTTSYLGYISHADRLESKLSHCRGIRRMKIRESVCRWASSPQPIHVSSHGSLQRAKFLFVYFMIFAQL